MLAGWRISWKRKQYCQGLEAGVGRAKPQNLYCKVRFSHILWLNFFPSFHSSLSSPSVFNAQGKFPFSRFVPNIIPLSHCLQSAQLMISLLPLLPSFFLTPEYFVSILLSSELYKSPAICQSEIESWHVSSSLYPCFRHMVLFLCETWC